MDALPKLFLTGALIVNMAITNYCYNNYGLSPDYTFLKGNRTIVETDAGDKKAKFMSNYTPTYDNVISSMAVMNETLSTGALYIDYRKNLDKKIFLCGKQFQVPNTLDSINGDFSVENLLTYKGQDTTAEIHFKNKPVAEIRIKNDVYYRLSSREREFKIDGFCVGDNILDVVHKWGSPSLIENSMIYIYSVSDKAEITFITTGDGYISWILYEGLKTEIIDTTPSEISTEQTTETTTASYPVAEEILKQRKKEGKK